MANPFVQHVYVHKINTLSDKIDQIEEGSVVFCKENHGMYIKIKGVLERFGGNDVIDSLDNDSTGNPLSAKQGMYLSETKADRTEVQTIENNLRNLIDDITLTVINSLDTDGEGSESKKVLSAEQGAKLKELIDEITLTTINNLNGATSEETVLKEVLSAEQGKVLLDLINDRTLRVINDLNGSAEEFIAKEVLSAEQGKRLKEFIDFLSHRIELVEHSVMVATLVNEIGEYGQDLDDGTYITILNSDLNALLVRTTKRYSLFNEDSEYVVGTGRNITYVQDES